MFMDTSQKYYESVMSDFKSYGRGRSLEQFCRDEAVDFKWLVKAKELYGDIENARLPKSSKHKKAKSPDLIRLHFDNESEVMETNAESENTKDKEDCKTEEAQWRVSNLRLVTPGGHEIEIKASDPGAVCELLTTLSA